MLINGLLRLVGIYGVASLTRACSPCADAVLPTGRRDRLAVTFWYFDEEEVRLSADLDFPTLASISTLRAWVQKQVHVSKVHGWNSLGPSLLLFPVCCADRELVHRACLVAGHSYK